MTELGFCRSELPPFSLMNSLCINDNGYSWSLDEDTCLQLRTVAGQCFPGQDIENKINTQMDSTSVLELFLTFTSDGVMGNFGYRGKLELFSFDSAHRKLLRKIN
ncbi:MAG: hypothetical protein WCK63_03220 [Betaproteobacteria bacterium]